MLVHITSLVVQNTHSTVGHYHWSIFTRIGGNICQRHLLIPKAWFPVSLPSYPIRRQDAPRAERYTWQLGVRVGSQSISPLYWALQTGGAQNPSIYMILLTQNSARLAAPRFFSFFSANKGVFSKRPSCGDILNIIGW